MFVTIAKTEKYVRIKNLKEFCKFGSLFKTGSPTVNGNIKRKNFELLHTLQRVQSFSGLPFPFPAEEPVLA